MRRIMGVGLLAIVLVMISACGSTSTNASLPADNSTENTSGTVESKDQSDKTNQKSTEAKENKNSAASSQDSKESQENGSSDSGEGKPKVEKSNEDKGIEARKNAVIAAILKFDSNFERENEDAKADYESGTLTWADQKVTLEIVPASNHEDDFKAGTVKALNANDGDIVKLYQYKIDDHNKLSLIDTISTNDKSYDYVIYATYIGDSDIHISSGDAAVEYLKQQIEAGKNEDIIFGDMGGSLEADRIGSYYTIRLVSETMRENGGTGTVNIYKVYQDGTYMPHT